MSCNFHVGQKVVCINDENTVSVEVGKVYTIKTLIDCDLPTRVGTWEGGLTLVEASPNPGTIGFARSRFRPVVTRKTDISIFTSMLNTQRTGVSA